MFVVAVRAIAQWGDASIVTVSEREFTVKIAVLERDLQQAGLVCGWLQEAGYRISHCACATDFVALLQCGYFDLALVDWVQYGEGGALLEEVLGGQALPVVVFTRGDSIESCVAPLLAGVAGCLLKPVCPAQLLACIQTIRGRAPCGVAPVLRLGPVQIDTRRRAVTVDGERVPVTHKDYEVAVCLIRNLGRLLSREYLLQTIWGVNARLNTRTVDMHVSRVRRSLRIGPAMGYRIRTVYQQGYRLEKTGGATAPDAGSTVADAVSAGCSSGYTPPD